jgi:hypothetical protein
MNNFQNICIGIGLCCFFVTATAMESAPPPEQCPQPRFTGRAPEPEYSYKNPLVGDKKNLASGKRLYEGKEKGTGCAICHGSTGAGNGSLASQFNPPPRNFACAKTVNSIPDGQLFWIIKNGSPGTAMPNHLKYNDTEIWQLVLYIRKLAER